MAENTKKIYYWLIQLLVWGFLVGVMLIAYVATGNLFQLKPWQYSLDFLFMFVICIFYTHQIRYFIKKYIEFDNLKITDAFKLLGFLFAAILLLIITYSVYIQLVYRFVHYRVDVLNHESQGLKNQIILYLNFTIYFIIWVAFYVGIKGLMELGKTRETRLKLESNLRDAQLNTLKGQINPHFMFNSLNNIRGLMLEDVPKSRDMLTRLSESLRYSLTKSGDNAIALEDELEMVDNYIEISKIQLEERLNYIAEIDNASLSLQIPPMLIQMLVENAVKHGISDLKNGGDVIVKTNVNSEGLSIVVSNSGSLKIDSNSTQLGLKNIKKRLELLYGDQASFSLTESNNQVVATIKIPLEK